MDLHEDIKQALEVLNNGGVILYPTDTIWGIGCDATNQQAVQRIYEIKQRADSKSMLALVHSDNIIQSYIEEMPDVAYDLIDYATKPLTIIYDGAKNFAPNLIAEDGSIGIRVVKEKFCFSLLQRFKRPIVSTSANVSGEASPGNFSEISEAIKEKVDYIVSYRQDEMANAKASSIMKLSNSGLFKIIRE